MVKYIWLTLFLACATTPRANLRSEAESRLYVCLHEYGQLHADYCLQETAKWCQAHGLERSCGSDGLWTRFPR
jgi:hypothetical protein